MNPDPDHLGLGGKWTQTMVALGSRHRSYAKSRICERQSLWRHGDQVGPMFKFVCCKAVWKLWKGVTFFIFLRLFVSFGRRPFGVHIHSKKRNAEARNKSTSWRLWFWGLQQKRVGRWFALQWPWESLINEAGSRWSRGFARWRGCLPLQNSPGKLLLSWGDDAELHEHRLNEQLQIIIFWYFMALYRAQKKTMCQIASPRTVLGSLVGCCTKDGYIYIFF